ncbi:MAG: response regulator [Deltaproteobacteria bacterium]|nr:response regulator [Deltaproteobacteria bacterium]
MEMMTLHLLIVEDNPDDAELAVKELERKGFNVKWTRVDTEEAFRKALAKKPDLILLDYSLPSFDCPAALEVYRQLHLEIPIIIVSGTIGEEVAVECMKSGATDYVLKDNLSRLSPVVKRALEEIKIYRENKQAEKKMKEMQAQLIQSQKMEAIGTLAGGVAHDFNNLLTVIIGNAQLALMNVIKDESLRKEIEDIKKAGEKAASLTRQLLAFSRKQIVQPRILNINELLTDIEKMLGRLIGEDIELLTIPAPALWQVEIDPCQIEQVIMNLAINAKDAMSICADCAAVRPPGGKLTIGTANADLDKNYFRERGIHEEKPGHYVMLAVSDTGSGMDKETREHIFEPFFTTKEVGKGTGLGLSTIYGIVKQNNGFIWVYSEPGKGTTFKIYLPKVKNAKPEEKKQTPVDDPGGSETVLIVEDDDNLRKLAQKALLQHGYKLLVAEDGEDALKVCKEYDGQIDLMITDVVMPKMGGREAADRLQPLYPQMKVIYMSGYTNNAIVRHGVLSPELNFLEKPFTPEGMARKVREVLRSEY